MSEEKKLYTGILHCCCCLGALAMLIISFIWSILAKKEVQKMNEGYNSLVASWQVDLAFDLSTDGASFPGLGLGGDMYVDKWRFEWPGTIEGCYCTVSNSRKRVTKGLKDRSCNYNESSVGCKKISEMEPKNATKWISSQEILVARVKSTNFYSTYKKMNPDGSCASGFKNCGDKTSNSRGNCIPDKVSACPIADVSTSPVAGSKTLQLAASAVYFSNQAGKNPFSDFLIAEEHLCFIRSQKALSAGRKKYPLLIGDYDNCKKDTAAVSLAAIGEADFFDINSINSRALPEFNTNNKYRYVLAAGKPLEWSPSCFDTVESMNDKQTDIGKVYSAHKVLFVLYIISLSVSAITFIFRFGFSVSGLNMVYKILFLIRLVFWLLVVPSLIIIFARFNSFYRFFQNITDLKCSSDANNAQFQSIADDMKTKVQAKHRVMLLLSIGGMIIEIFMAYLNLSCVNNESSGTYKPSLHSAATPSAPFNPSFNSNSYLPRMVNASNHELLEKKKSLSGKYRDHDSSTAELTAKKHPLPEGFEDYSKDNIKAKSKRRSRQAGQRSPNHPVQHPLPEGFDSLSNSSDEEPRAVLPGPPPFVVIDPSFYDMQPYPPSYSLANPPSLAAFPPLAANHPSSDDRFGVPVVPNVNYPPPPVDSFQEAPQYNYQPYNPSFY